jgi:hypothetical protein
MGNEVDSHEEKLSERRQEVTIPSIPPPDPPPAPVVPAAIEIFPPPPSPAPAEPAPPPPPGAPIEDLLEYLYSIPVPEELIRSLFEAPGINKSTLRYALIRLCQRKYRYKDRWGLIGAIRSVLYDR